MGREVDERRKRQIERSREDRRIRKLKSIKFGVCRTCGFGKPREGERQCYKCWLSDRSVKLLGSRRKAQELEAILKEYDYKCAYTGLTLERGKTLSFDHVRPKETRARNNRKQVVVPCHIVLNRMKGNLTLKDFLSAMEHTSKNVDKIIRRFYG